MDHMGYQDLSMKSTLADRFGTSEGSGLLPVAINHPISCGAKIGFLNTKGSQSLITYTWIFQVCTDFRW